MRHESRAPRSSAYANAELSLARRARTSTHAASVQQQQAAAAAVFHLVSQLSRCHESGSIAGPPLFRVFRGDPVQQRANELESYTYPVRKERTMRCRAMRGTLTTALCIVLGLMVVRASTAEPLPSVLLGGIGNVASSATNFLTGVVQRQKELLHRVTDTATNYITNAVERPRNLLINATRMTTGYIDSAASRGLEYKLRRFLEKFRNRMRNGIPELGIPPLEPFTLDEIDIDTDNPEIGKVHLVIEDLELRKLSTFLIDRAKLSLIGPTIAVNISIPEIYASGYYNISGVLGDMYPLYGAGPFQMTVRDFRIYANTMLGYARGMYMKKFDLDFSLRAIKIHLDNFMGGQEIGQIMSKVFEELTPEAMDIIKPDILPVIQNYVASNVNETIHHLTMRDLFHVLLGEYEFGDITQLLIP